MPAPLPPRIEYSPDLVAKLSEADHALGELAGVGRNLPNPHLLIGPFKRREAVLSSRIEGTRAEMGDLMLFEAEPTREPAIADVREVQNYVSALDYGLQRLASLPVSKRLILELHAKLMEGVRGQERTPGEFRRSQNWIGPEGCTLREATYVPPPPEELHACLDALERFIHERAGAPALVRVALIHYQFEAIHPFLDGNGRVGRLLITLLLMVEGRLPGPLLYLSAFFERRRQDYYRHLLAVSQTESWTGWVSFVLEGVREQAADAVERSKRLFDLRDQYRVTVMKLRSAALLLRMVDQLFEHPATNVESAQVRLSVSQSAALKSVKRLVDADILEEVTGRQRGRVWVAKGIREIVS